MCQSFKNLKIRPRNVHYFVIKKPWITTELKKTILIETSNTQKMRLNLIRKHYKVNFATSN